jgi:hypothetical protein
MTKKCCSENWDIIPYASKHAWRSGLHGEPIGGCLHCGKMYEDYSKKMIDKILEAHDEEMKELKAQAEVQAQEE